MSNEPTGDVGNIDEEIDLTSLFQGEEKVKSPKKKLKTL